LDRKSRKRIRKKGSNEKRVGLAKTGSTVVKKDLEEKKKKETQRSERVGEEGNFVEKEEDRFTELKGTQGSIKGNSQD